MMEQLESRLLMAATFSTNSVKRLYNEVIGRRPLRLARHPL